MNYPPKHLCLLKISKKTLIAQDYAKNQLSGFIKTSLMGHQLKHA